MIEDEANIRRTERPVSVSALRRLAEEGYPELVHLAIRYAERPILLTEGVSLRNKALRVEAARQEAEANRLIGLSHLSNDPRWQSLFGSRIDELTRNATDNVRKADESDAFIRLNSQEGADLA